MSGGTFTFFESALDSFMNGVEEFFAISYVLFACRLEFVISLVVCVSFGLFGRSLERDVVEEFLSEVGRLESFTLFSRTFMDTVEDGGRAETPTVSSGCGRTARSVAASPLGLDLALASCGFRSPLPQRGKSSKTERLYRVARVRSIRWPFNLYSGVWVRSIRWPFTAACAAHFVERVRVFS